MLPITAGGSFVMQRILAAWGILDSFSVLIGDWLKVNVTPAIYWSTETTLWIFAFIIFIMIYGAALAIIWRHGRQAYAPADAVPRLGSAGNSQIKHSSTETRIPIMRLREMASASGWNVDRHTSNDGFDLTNKLNQAAADGVVQFWGRKYQYEFGEDAAESEPLVRISQKHFLDYRFESTNLFGDTKNFYIFTGQLSKQPRQLKGLIYRDIHVDRKQIEAWLPAR
jgi:hypothetical protein